jgi:hypothetical protein
MFQAARPGSKLLLAGLFAGICVGVAFAQTPPPRFDLSSGNAGWISEGTEWLAVPEGPQPVTFDPKFPYVPNNTGKQPTFRVADLSNPNLTDFAKAELKKSNDMVHSGFAMYAREARCWASGIPVYLLNPAQPTYFLQTPKKITMVWQMDQQVRHVHMDVPHSANPKPSWYGESVGRFEGDTLVIDTIGLNDKTAIDGFETPHTEQLHVVERFRLVDPETLELEVYVEDPGAFTTPWRAIQRYSRKEGIARRTNVANVAMLASAGEGPLLEAICAENPGSLMGLETIPIAQSKTPDF